MKSILLFIILVVPIFISAQTKNTITVVCPSEEGFKGLLMQMPDYREIVSGTKLVVTYEGDWSEEMRGAFEYAVKIWEENLPMSLPINITAKIAPLRRSDVLSQVGFHTYDFDGVTGGRYAYPTSMIKSVLLQEYNSYQKHQFYREIQDTSILDKEDIVITYNQNRLNEFSFSLNEEIDNKFDFVTVALRDIVRGLGFGVNITANPVDKIMYFTDSTLSPFESHIMKAIGSKDPSEAYSNVTKGFLDLELENWGGLVFDKVKLYAPEIWENGVSLQCFISEDDKPITRLLSSEFGKGYIMRDLSGCDWRDIFCGTLDWRRELVTDESRPNNRFSENGNTSNMLPFKGTADISVGIQNQSVVEESAKVKYLNNKALRINENIYPTDFYCSPFSLSYVGEKLPVIDGISICVLLKNGHWDNIYYDFAFFSPITIDIENLPLNYPTDEYARSVGGGLRYRIAYLKNQGRDIVAKYYTRDFTPQSARIKYSRIHDESNLKSMSLYANDDYFIDVEVGISNVEGTTRVMVEQTDEGELVPFVYEVSDFKKGYFIANLDRELSTQLTVISYNDNGSTRSNTIIIPPIGYQKSTLSLIKQGDKITVSGLTAQQLTNGSITCKIINPLYPTVVISPQIDSNGKMDVSNLTSGVYSILVYDKNERIGELKFVH